MFLMENQCHVHLLQIIIREEELTLPKKYISLGQKWIDVIFSDETKFNLDEPDGFCYFWYDLRKTKEEFSKRQYGGGSVKV